jgi:hypothetical protein
MYIDIESVMWTQTPHKEFISNTNAKNAHIYGVWQ